ncbi:MAG: hypothetical protein AABX33_07070 [Nanoarchaeota archaeon]
MNKRYIALAILVCLILLVSACNRSGAATGGAPRKPFIGGAGAITMNFEKDSPPPEVTDQGTFPFNVLVRLKNDGEFKVDKENIRLNLIGFDPESFGSSFSALNEVTPEDSLEPKKIDAEGNTVDGATTVAAFPSGGSDQFNARKFIGNTEFTFRVDACYLYGTQSSTKLCVLRDMVNVRDNSICKPNGAKTIYNSAGPVQVTNFRQTVVGQKRLSFSFDIVLNGNVDIFYTKDTLTSPTTPSTGFDAACPRDPSARRQVENNVAVAIVQIPVEDRVLDSLKCVSLDRGDIGVVKLVNQRRTITCTADIRQERVDLEKDIAINLLYNVLDSKETKVLVKHLASDTSPGPSSGPGLIST